jgi:hypothetical protein
MSVATYQLPELCCRCAQKQGASLWTIMGSSLPGINYLRLIMRIERTGYCLHVPVCEECFERLTWLTVRNKRLNYLLFALSFLVRIYILLQTHILLISVLVSLLFYCIFSLLLKSREASQLGRYRGQYFWFSQSEFFKQFAQLNPTLVNPYEYQRFFNN